MTDTQRIDQLTAQLTAIKSEIAARLNAASLNGLHDLATNLRDLKEQVDKITQ